MSAKHKVRKKKTEGSDDGFRGVFKHSLVGFLYAVFILMMLLLVATGVALSTEDPDSLIGTLAFSALYISALFSGLITAKRCGKNALISGMLSGIWLVISLLIISFFLNNTSSQGHPLGIEMLIRGSFILVSVLGGYIGANKPKSKKRRRG